MKQLQAILLSILFGACAFAQDDPFAGGEDTAVDAGGAPEAAAIDPATGEAVIDPNAAPPEPVAPPPPPDPSVAGDSMVFHPDLKQMEFDVTVNAMKTVNEKFNAPAFARTKGARKAIHPPILLPSQVEASIQEEVDRRVQVEYPDTRYEEIKEEAEAEYVMYKVGDRVTISVKPRGDKYIPLTGDLLFVTSNRIKISNFPIAKEDIASQYLPRLYRVEHEKAVQKFVSRKTRIFNEQRSQYADVQRQDLTKRMWIDAGYYPKGKDDFVPLSTAFSAMYANVRDKEYEQAFKAGREQVYLDSGWVFDPTLNRWLSPEEQLPPEPLLGTEPETATDPEAGTAGTGSIFDQIGDLIKKEGKDDDAAKPDGGDDIFGEDPKKPDAKTPKGGAKDPAPAPGDNDDLFGE